MESKKEIRKKILEIRDGLSTEQRKMKSEQILERVYRLDDYQRATYILSFASFGSEVDTVPLLCNTLYLGKHIFYPKIIGDFMDFYSIGSEKELQPGYKGILEPTESGVKFSDLFKQLSKEQIFVLVPGVAFDSMRNRLGYGKGFYDSFFHKYGMLPNAAIGFQCQIVEKLPADVYDVKPERVITEYVTFEY